MKKARQTDRIATTIVPNGRYGALSSGISRWIERSPPLANTPGLPPLESLRTKPLNGSELVRRVR